MIFSKTPKTGAVRWVLCKRRLALEAHLVRQQKLVQAAPHHELAAQGSASTGHVPQLSSWYEDLLQLSDHVGIELVKPAGCSFDFGAR